jgi:hypothetical protein
LGIGLSGQWHCVRVPQDFIDIGQNRATHPDPVEFLPAMGRLEEKAARSGDRPGRRRRQPRGDMIGQETTPN